MSNLRLHTWPLLLLFTLEIGAGAARVVRLPLGAVRGRAMECVGCPRPVTAFLGLPYASPPTGPLRYRPAQPPTPWAGVRDAAHYGSVCLQNGDGVRRLLAPLNFQPYTGQSEDCLNLNVYSPEGVTRHPPLPDTTLSPSDPLYKPLYYDESMDPELKEEEEEGSDDMWSDGPILPVMVWVHPGRFNTGAGSVFDGTVLAARENMVVVTLNYRLDILGSVSVEGPSVKHADLAAQDVLAALQWVQRYIHHFKGDPRAVTLAGHDTGSVLISRLLLASNPRTAGKPHNQKPGQSHDQSHDKSHDKSPKRSAHPSHDQSRDQSADLFQQVIMQSTYALHCHLKRSAANFTEKLHSYAERMGCPVDTHLARCLRDVSNTTLQFVMSRQVATIDGWSCFHGEGKEVNLTKIYRRTMHKKLKVVSGVTSCVGCWGVKQYCPLADKSTFDFPACKACVRHFLQQFYEDTYMEDVYSAVLDFYFSPHRSKLSSGDFLRRRIIDIMGDLMYNVATYWEARKLSALGHDVYFYQYAHQPVYLLHELPLRSKGANHYRELPLFWGFPFLRGKARSGATYQQSEKALSRQLMEYVGSFVRTGNPNVNTTTLPQWPVLTPGDEKHLVLKGAPQVLSTFLPGRLEFWSERIPTLLGRLKPQYTKSPDVTSHIMTSSDDRESTDPQSHTHQEL